MATIATKKKRMTQLEVIELFAESTGMKRVQVKEFFEEMANLAAREVKASGEFVLPGFGKLVKRERRSRSGRNPATGETIQIPAKTTLKFQVGKAMKDSVFAEWSLKNGWWHSRRRWSALIYVSDAEFANSSAREFYKNVQKATVGFCFLWLGRHRMLFRL
jgi:DNA-binding protein HU-beta